MFFHAWLRFNTSTLHPVLTATPNSPPAAPQDESEVEAGATGALPPPAAAALRRGAFHLVACLSPAELQHLHVVLAPGLGAARRTALQALKKDYDSLFKYTGKV